MKTTVEIPDQLFREAKTAAASRGLSLKTFLTEALKEKLSGPRRRRGDWPVPPPKLAEGEVRRIQSTIDGEFSKPENDIWIASQCRQHRLPVASRDGHLDKVHGLKRVSW
ncbi:MAG: hypothetical protein EXS36_08160 [Pedosphaera sp.]|nr:hypothetical protein [Pedosphaera sp.]